MLVICFALVIVVIRPSEQSLFKWNKVVIRVEISRTVGYLPIALLGNLPQHVIIACIIENDVSDDLFDLLVEM